jgi:hypothetical protein
MKILAPAILALWLASTAALLGSILVALLWP